MLIGFPLDYWSISYIQDAIKSFGKLLVWEKDLNNLSRIIIKARVLDLDQVPKSTQITDGDGFLSESWTVPCEIIYQTLLGMKILHQMMGVTLTLLPCKIGIIN